MGNRDTSRAEIAKLGRRDRLIKERVHDPYMTRSKPGEPTVCPECGVVFAEGRWQWLPSPPADADRELCPACWRARDKVPAGFLTLSGDFFAEHRDEIMNLVRNKVDLQKAEHPMKRIMGTEEAEDGGVVILFTDLHLPRGVGEAIESAYEGELDIQYTEGKRDSFEPRGHDEDSRRRGARRRDTRQNALTSGDKP